jgi:MoxR-like ATPase
MTKTRGPGRPVGTTIPARFKGHCKQCGSSYSAGAPITKIADKTWVHAACAGQLPPAAHDVPSFSNGEAPLPEASSLADRVTADEIHQMVRAELEGAELSVDESEVRAVVRDEMAKAGALKVEIEVKLPSGQVNKIEEKVHCQFERALRLAACRKNILLVGPAGCGKTHLAEQAAKGLGLPFAFISCTAGMSEGQLLGRLVPTGENGKFQYLRSEFVKSYEEGGVFLFDELDAADSNTLLTLNSALANGQMAIPNRPEKPFTAKHPDFVCIAAANTFGTGADRQYVGRNQLDESTLDRFRIGQIEMDYDPQVEKALCPDDELRTRLQGYRRKSQEARLSRLVSMRFLRDAYQMKQAGDTDEEIDAALFAGWSADEIRKVKGL